MRPLFFNLQSEAGTAKHFLQIIESAESDYQVLESSTATCQLARRGIACSAVVLKGQLTSRRLHRLFDWPYLIWSQSGWMGGWEKIVMPA